MQLCKIYVGLTIFCVYMCVLMLNHLINFVEDWNCKLLSELSLLIIG